MFYIPGLTDPLKRPNLLGVKACLDVLGKSAFLEGLCCCQPGRGIRHGSELGSQDKDQMSALGARPGPMTQGRLFS